jgi:hypothetical protein
MAEAVSLGGFSGLRSDSEKYLLGSVFKAVTPPSAAGADVRMVEE